MVGMRPAALPLSLNLVFARLTKSVAIFPIIQSCRASTFSSEERGKPKVTPQIEESSLPLLQRCKNLLAANWRTQFTTIKANGEDPNASKVHGSLVNYVLVAGKPILWIPKNDQHEPNILIDERASMVVGHTDPPPLIHAWREVGHVPTRTVLLGSVTPLESHEKEYVRRRVSKVRDATKGAITAAKIALQNVLRNSGRSISARVQALSAMADSSDTDFAMFRLVPKACHFVDLLGVRHEVQFADIAGTAVDPLSPILTGLIEGINQNEGSRFALIVFCAVYLQVRVQDAYIFAADRWGFNVLAKVVQNEKSEVKETSKLWREFRFAFSREVKDAEGFCVLLAEMEKESLEALHKAQEVDLNLVSQNPQP